MPRLPLPVRGSAILALLAGISSFGAAPVISSFDPASMDVSTTSQTLVVNGSGFVSGSVFEWNGRLLETAFRSATQLSAVVPAALLAQAGTVPVKVRNPDGIDSEYRAYRVLATTVEPVITGFSPSGTRAGATNPVVFTVNGFGFARDAQITVDGAPVSTVWVDGNTLRTVFPVSMLQAVKTYRVSVFSSGMLASAVTFSVWTGARLGSLSPSQAGAGSAAVSAGPGGRNLTVTVDASGLEAGAVATGTVRVQAEGVTPDTVEVPVEIRVDAEPAGDVVIQTVPGSLRLAAGQGGAVVGGGVTVTNPGTAAEFTATASLPWLAVTPERFTSGGGTPVTLTISADPALAGEAAVFPAEVVVAAVQAAVSKSIPVEFTLSAAPRLVLSRPSLRFTALKGGDAPPAAVVDVLANGAASAIWMSQVDTANAVNWLSFGPSAGTTPAVGQLKVDASSLEEGLYAGTLTLAAPRTDNRREQVEVFLEVSSAAGTAPAFAPGQVAVREGDSVVFTANGAWSYSSVAVTDDAAGWCGLNRESGSVKAGGEVGLRVDFSALTEGVHRCSVRLLFSDGTVGSLTVLAIAGTAATCSGQLATLREPLDGFSATLRRPVNLELELRDACGEALNGAVVPLEVSSGDLPVTLVSVGKGIYRGSWTPQNAAATVALGSNVLRNPVKGTVRNDETSSDAVAAGGPDVVGR
jgi:hypothetical protein